ncbi:hypothetical protein TC41_0118 [Alicyclobacillus acidocaldarius subsp. acidocaldarius Tc-4-1]|uniref:Uncharacterized protein n=1 Tax=Alicyclobacillus acidocaldarius (strain Tc-4-1) TaxID=1048834 RepID=F8IID6_ALIAT|nr:hypothetical protein TC41_0118 [Alicyclobacillus acidocaldarius subsp. acidocaldarius Tc-4-1]
MVHHLKGHLVSCQRGTRAESSTSLWVVHPPLYTSGIARHTRFSTVACGYWG